jgi:hypothetical protein
MILDREGSNTRPELRSEATHPRLFGQQAESVDDGVDESVHSGGAGGLGDVGPDLLEVLLRKSGQPIRHL